MNGESMDHTSEKALPISVIVPAYNEEEGVVESLKQLRQVLAEHQITHEIIVVDDGSQDKTAQLAGPVCDTLIQQPENRGYGAALKIGIDAAKYETIVTIDADGTYPSTAIPQMMALALKYDMVVGARTGAHVKNPLARRPAKWVLRRLASYLAGRPIPDLNSGLRLMNKASVKRFYHILPAGFSFTTTITLALLCNNYFVHYHPIDYFHRIGRSKIRSTHAYDFWLLILRTIVYFNPLKVFMPLGALLFATGLGKGIYDLFIGNLSETAVMGFLGACIIWAIGLLADLIARVSSGGGSR